MMCHCPDIELELAAYCSGELDPVEREQVEIHLDTCASCRAELAREMSLRNTLGTLPPVTAPANLQDGIFAALGTAATEPDARPRRRRLTVAITLVAASVAVALLVPGLRSGSDQTWTDQEIAAARQDVMYTLALTAKVIDRTQKDAVIDVFADKLPKAINDSFKMVKPNNSGGNG